MFPLQLKSVESLSQHQTDYQYDVFVSYSEAEYEFVRDILLPSLEKEYRVCFPERDIVLGKSISDQYRSSIERSRKCIVLLSRGFKNDKMYEDLQLNRILLIMLKDKRRALFIMYDEGACLAEELKNDVRTQVLDWQSFISESQKLVSMNQWVRTGKVA